MRKRVYRMHSCVGIFSHSCVHRYEIMPPDVKRYPLGERDNTPKSNSIPWLTSEPLLNVKLLVSLL